MSDVDNREGYPCVGQGVYEKSLYLLNFIVNLKLFSKIVFFLNRLLENIQIKYREKKVENTEKKTHNTYKKCI